MQNLKNILVGLSLTALLLLLSFQAQAQNGGNSDTRRALNSKSTVIIDYVDSFEHHRTGHSRGGGGGGEDPPVEHTLGLGHFELIGGVWPDSDTSDLDVDPNLHFVVDLRGFPGGSEAAIDDSFSAWDNVTHGFLVGSLTFVNAVVGFGDGINTYSMRNLGGGGVLAATFITWNDINNDGLINNSEPFLEMDVIHNSTVKWGIDESNPKGRWWDVQNVATHEIGHVFGLAHPGNAHSVDEDQTMFASSPPKETDKRSPHPDGDIPGIQSIPLGYGS